MQEKKTSVNFSQSYYRHIHPLNFEYHTELKKEDFLEGPFSELEYVLYKYSNIKAVNDYKLGLQFYKNVEQKRIESLERFNFEGCSLGEHMQDYINETLTYLINKYKTVQNYKIKVLKTVMRKEVGAYINIVLNVYKKLFWEIQRMFNFEINQENRIFLNQNLNLEEPITSFYLKQKVERQHFEFLYYKYLHTKFTSYPTDFGKFIILFENKVVANKIDWIGTKSSLVYFIKQLVRKDLIINPKNKHWKKVSETILYRGEPILPKDLINQQPPKKKDQINLNKFLEGFLT